MTTDAADFEKCVEFVLKREGGLVDDPDDPGGLTNFGISIRYNPEFTRQEIIGMTREKAKSVYRRKYWETVGAGKLAWPVNLVAFDSAVNPGLGRALEFLAACPLTNAPKIRAQAVINMRRAYYADRIRLAPKKQKYARGWENRLKALEALVAAA